MEYVTSDGFNGLLILISFCILCLAYLLWSRNALQHKLSMVESDIVSFKNKLSEFENKEFTKDQLDYKDQLKSQYDALFRQVEDNIKSHVQKLEDSTSALILDAHAEFAIKLKEEFDKACKAIKFDEITYKRTITKKRQEFNRKHGKDAKPERLWRYIDEE